MQHRESSSNCILCMIYRQRSVYAGPNTDYGSHISQEHPVKNSVVLTRPAIQRVLGLKLSFSKAAATRYVVIELISP